MVTEQDFNTIIFYLAISQAWAYLIIGTMLASARYPNDRPFTFARWGTFFFCGSHLAVACYFA